METLLIPRHLNFRLLSLKWVGSNITRIILLLGKYCLYLVGHVRVDSIGAIVRLSVELIVLVDIARWLNLQCVLELWIH